MKINFKITTKCPANCKCCQERLNNFLEIENYKENRELYNKIIKIFESSGDKINNLSITGGEPTIIDGLYDIVYKFTERGIRVGIDSNGWNIDYKWLKKMEEVGLEYVLFSFYSLNKDIFNYLRGSKNNELFLRATNAKKCMEYYKKNGGKVKIRLQTVIMKENYLELPSMLEMAIKSGFDSFSTAYYISNNCDENLIMGEKEIERFNLEVKPAIEKVLKKYIHDYKKRRSNIEKLDEFFVFNKVSKEELHNGIYRPKGENCNDYRKIAIYPNGDIAPCLAFDYRMERKFMRNINTINNFDIKNNESFFGKWSEGYDMCRRCSSGHQIWFDL